MNPSPGIAPSGGLSESRQAANPTEKVVVEGARRLWGTHQETVCTAVRKAICRLCHNYSSTQQLRIRQKTKSLPNNRLIWWFVLHDDEDKLKTLENSWEQIQLQTDWKIEPCYMPATLTDKLPASQTISQIVASNDTNSNLDPSSSDVVDNESDPEFTQVTHDQEPADNGTSNLHVQQPSQQRLHYSVSNHPLSFPNSNFCTILYFNARSLVPKLDNLFLSVVTHQPHIICIVETWLSSEIDSVEVDIPGYQLYRRDRNRQGGAILVYVIDFMSVKLFQDPDPSLELLALSVSCNNFKGGSPPPTHIIGGSC